MARTLSGHDQINAALKKLKNEATEKELQLIQLVSNVYDSVKEQHEMAVGKVKEVASTVDDEVHTHPWRYIGGAAVVGLILGRLLRK